MYQDQWEAFLTSIEPDKVDATMKRFTETEGKRLQRLAAEEYQRSIEEIPWYQSDKPDWNENEYRIARQEESALIYLKARRWLRIEKEWWEK